MAGFDKAKYKREWMSRRRERWREAGACYRCGVPVEKFASCGACRSAESETRAKRLSAR